MGATATCRLSTGAGSWALFPASISAASNWIAWTKRPVCGRGSDGRNQRMRTADLEARSTTLPGTAEEEARKPAMATDELLREQWKSADVGLSSSMPALAQTPRCGSRCRPYRRDPVWFVLAVPTRSPLCARKWRGHLLREPISLGPIGFCYRDFHHE